MKAQIKIDEIDAKMLRMLLAESRTSFTDIAAECKITVGAVRMRFKRLLKEGVINGEVMLVNPHCLGYRHIVDLGIATDHENEKEIAAYLESKPYISQLVAGPLGKFNFFGKVALRELNKLSEIVEDLESNSKIKRIDTMIWTEAVNVEFPMNVVLKPLKYESVYSRSRPPLTNLDQPPIKLDEIDRKIAVILSQKSRTPFRKIAEQLDLSTKTIIQRYKKLRENVLTLSTITVDLNKLGYSALAHLYIKVTNRSKMTEIYSQLLQTPNLIVIIRLIGSFDLYVAIILEDFWGLFGTLMKINTINGLEKPEVYLTPVPHSWPLNLFPSLLEKENMPKYWSDGSQ